MGAMQVVEFSTKSDTCELRNMRPNTYSGAPAQERDRERDQTSIEAKRAEQWAI
jgi:hypothetical protein